MRILALIVPCLALVLLGSAGQAESSEDRGRNVLVLIDTSQSVYLPDSPDAERAYRMAPIEAIEALLTNAGGKNRVWLGFFKERVYFYNPAASTAAGMALSELPEGMRAPSAAVREASELRRSAAAFQGSLATAVRDWYPSLSLQTPADAQLARQLLAKPETSWTPSGSTNLVNAIYFATEFLTAQVKHTNMPGSVYLYTDSQHFQPASTNQHGYVIQSKGAAASQLEVLVRSGDERATEQLTHAAIAYAKDRLNLVNQVDPVAASFVQMKWLKAGYFVPEPQVRPQAYLLWAIASRPRADFQSTATGNLPNGLGGTPIQATWGIPLSLAATAGPGMDPATLRVFLVQARIDADRLEPERHASLERVQLVVPETTFEVKSGGPTAAATPVLVPVPTIAGATTPEAAFALLDPRGVPFTLEFRLDEKSLPQRDEKGGQAVPALWADAADSSARAFVVHGTLRGHEVPAVDLVDFPKGVITLPRGDDERATVSVRMNWNAASATADHRVALAPLGAEASTWATIVGAALRAEGATEVIEADASSRSLALPSDARTGVLDIYLRGTAAHPVAAPATIEVRWVDGSPFANGGAVPVSALCPEGAVDVRVERRAGTTLEAWAVADLCELSVSPRDLNAVGQKLRVRVGSGPGWVLSVKRDGTTVDTSVDDNNRYFEVGIPEFGRTDRYLLQVRPGLTALKGGQIVVDWAPTDPRRATLATGTWSTAGEGGVSLQQPKLQLRLAPISAGVQGFHPLELGDALVPGDVIDLEPRVHLDGLPKDFDGAPGLDLGRVRLTNVGSRSLSTASLLVNGEARDSIDIAQLLADPPRIRVAVRHDARSAMQATSVRAILRLEGEGSLGAMLQPVELRVKGNVPASVDTTLMLVGGLVGILLLGFLVAWLFTRRPIRSAGSEPSLANAAPAGGESEGDDILGGSASHLAAVAPGGGLTSQAVGGEVEGSDPLIDYTASID